MIRFAVESYRKETGKNVLAHRPIARREYHAASVEDGTKSIGECLKDVYASSAELGFGPLAVRIVVRAYDVDPLSKEGVLNSIKRLRDRINNLADVSATADGWENEICEGLDKVADILEFPKR